MFLYCSHNAPGKGVHTMSNDWAYAIEIQPDSTSLLELAGAARLYFKGHPAVAHEVAVERPARLVVRFTCEEDARNFYYANSKLDARFCRADNLGDAVQPAASVPRKG